MKAVWNGKVIAESEKTVTVEGNHYFPMDTVRREFLKPSDTQSICPWKGLAFYQNVVVEGRENRDAAWYYPQPKEAASEIKDHIAFWKGVEIIP
jgi:uncharacterized protein (DUF427 family)